MAPFKIRGRRPMAESVRRPPSGAAADLCNHPQHHLQRRDRVRARRLRLRQRRQAAWHGRDRAALVDFKFNDQFSWRAPGIDLVPIGYINQHHEPTQFYSVQRPELYNGLIPSTWKVPATSIYGTIVDGMNYQLMPSSARMPRISATISIFRTDQEFSRSAGTVFSRRRRPQRARLSPTPPLGDFTQLNNSPAVTGRVDFALPSYARPGLERQRLLFAPNIEPRGAHGDSGQSARQHQHGDPRRRVPLSHPADTGWNCAAKAFIVTFSNPANLRANNDSDPTNNVGKTMYGFSGEFDLHVPMGTILNTEWEAVPFYRYTNQNFQTAGFAGTDANMPTGAGQTHSTMSALQYSRRRRSCSRRPTRR